jgi:hypothetical protein
MFKKYLITILLTTFVLGICWYAIGRPNVANIRGTYNGAWGDFTGVERLINQYTTDVNRFIDKVATVGSSASDISTESKSTAEFVRAESEWLSNSLEQITGGVRQLEEYGRQIIRLSIRLEDVAFGYRQRNKESRTEE